MQFVYHSLPLPVDLPALFKYFDTGIKIINRLSLLIPACSSYFSILNAELEHVLLELQLIFLKLFLLSVLPCAQLELLLHGVYFLKLLGSIVGFDFVKFVGFLLLVLIFFVEHVPETFATVWIHFVKCVFLLLIFVVTYGPLQQLFVVLSGGFHLGVWAAFDDICSFGVDAV